jgi:hypothetical protein
MALYKIMVNNRKFKEQNPYALSNIFIKCDCCLSKAGTGSLEFYCFVLNNLLNRQSSMRGEKKKPFIRGIGNTGDSRKSELAKQAISAICGDAPFSAPSSADESAVNLHPSPENISPAQVSCEPSLSESKLESALDTIEKESELKTRLDDKLRTCQERIADLEGQLKREKDVPVKDEIKIETGVCDCCDKTDVKIDQLVSIDSGQLLCSDCLNELRS